MNRYHCLTNLNTPFKSSKIAAMTIKNDGEVWCDCPKFLAAPVNYPSYETQPSYTSSISDAIAILVKSLFAFWIYGFQNSYIDANLYVECKFEYTNFGIRISCGNSRRKFDYTNFYDQQGKANWTKLNMQTNLISVQFTQCSVQSEMAFGLF